MSVGIVLSMSWVAIRPVDLTVGSSTKSLELCCQLAELLLSVERVSARADVASILCSCGRTRGFPVFFSSFQRHISNLGTELHPRALLYPLMNVELQNPRRGAARIGNQGNQTEFWHRWANRRHTWVRCLISFWCHRCGCLGKGLRPSPLGIVIPFEWFEKRWSGSAVQRDLRKVRLLWSCPSRDREQQSRESKRKHRAWQCLTLTAM